MSTKIYNGIKFRSRDWKEVLDQLLDIKKKAVEMGHKAIKKDDLVLFITGNNLEDKQPFEIFYTLQEAINEGNQRNRWCFLPRFTFTMMLYPTKSGEIYGYYFDQVHGYYNFLESITEDFHYQNQSDRPDHISEEDWDKRRDIWDELVPDRFSDTGFKFMIVSGDDLDRSIIQPQITELLESIKRDKKIDKVFEIDGDK